MVYVRAGRQVVGRYKVPAGDTLTIIPSTYEPGKKGEYLLRVWHSNKSSVSTCK